MRVPIFFIFFDFLLKICYNIYVIKNKGEIEMADITKSQERRFVEQFCSKCESQMCDFSLEWRENCPTWRKFEQTCKRENAKLRKGE